jgi:hypothetical protein
MTVLVKLALDGRCRETTKMFRDTIQQLPGNLTIALVDAYETDASALVLVRISWHVWVRFSEVRDLEVIGVIIGNSLMHELDTVGTMHPINQAGENIPPIPFARPYR